MIFFNSNQSFQSDFHRTSYEMIMALQGDQKSHLRHVSVSGFEKEKRHYSEEDELFQDSF